MNEDDDDFGMGIRSRKDLRIILPYVRVIAFSYTFGDTLLV